MKDYYGRTLRQGDYIRYGSPNRKSSRPTGKVDHFTLDNQILITFNRHVESLGWSRYTLSKNVVKLKEAEIIVAKLKGEL